MNPQPTSKPPRRPRGSVKNLAAALGITPRHTSELLKSGMPEDIAAAKAWRGENGTTSDKAADDSPAELRRRRIALLTRQEQKIAMEIAVRNRELVDAGEVQQSVARLISVARGEFLKLSSDLPPRLAGLTEAKMSVVIRDEVVEILTRLSDEGSALYNDPD